MNNSASAPAGDTAGQRGPDPIDVAAGRHLRARRMMMGLSQAELGEQVGVTFQQIQKYERGSNRISLSRFVRICKVLKIRPEDFFKVEDIDGNTGEIVSADTDIIVVTAALARLKRQNHRSFVGLVEMIKAFVPGAGLIAPGGASWVEPAGTADTGEQDDSDEAYGAGAGETVDVGQADDASEGVATANADDEQAGGDEAAVLAAQTVLDRAGGRLVQKVRTRMGRGMTAVDIAADIQSSFRTVEDVIAALKIVGR